jgi:hypothetical protein
VLRTLRTRAFAGFVALVGCAAMAAPAQAAHRIALGVSIDGAPDNPAQLTSYTQLAGRSPAIVMWYQSWSEPLYYANQLPPVDSLGAEPLITWSPEFAGRGLSLRKLTGGGWDPYIHAQARLAKAYGKPMMIRLAHEMNLRGVQYGNHMHGNTPRQFRKFWRHVVTIFRSEGASNVDWVWSPNVYCGGKCPFKKFYPGNKWTDWVGLDGYNYAQVEKLSWMSITDVFAKSYDRLTRLTNKPVMIAETATTEHGGNKAAWIRHGLLRAVPKRMPRVRALLWFNRRKETDWRVNSSRSALAAWRSVVSNPLYQAPPPVDVKPFPKRRKARRAR